MMKPFALALCALVLSGCVSVLPESQPPAPRYLLEPVTYDEAAGEAVSWSLAIEDPTSTRVYDSTKIALIREPGRVEYYAGGEWADRAPRLFQTALTRSFENTGKILAVGDRSTMPMSRFVLQTDIRALHAEYDGGRPAATVSIYARLATGRGRIIEARLFETSLEAGADSVPEVAAAFDSAVSQTVSEIIAWLLDEADEAYAEADQAK